MAETQETAKSALWTTDQDGYRNLTIPAFEFEPLEEDEQRFFVLQPAEGQASHVRCELEVSPLFDAPPYIAVKNARGYRLLEDPIEVNGKGMIISAALELFLRHYRATINEPTRLWIRHLCVNQYDNVERTQFWTRDWSDTMYAMATEVIDMSTFNADLLDRGVIQPVGDSRYAKRTKKWYGGLDSVTLPKVYPIRLGALMKNPKIEAPVADYQYSPLDPVANEIRIVVLVPSADSSAPIVLDLAHCPMRCDVDFAALSYRWGDDDKEGMITLNGQRKYIRRNLEEALRSIRHKERLQPLWIDAISINQEDVQERGRQVPRMGRLYDSASAVICYVGAASEDSDMALELIKELQQPMMRLNGNRDWHFGEWSYDQATGITFGENRIEPPRLALMSAALYKLLTRSYFRRNWVLQENAFASNPTIGIGTNYETKFDQLDMAVYNFESMLSNDPSLKGQILSADDSLEDLDIDQLAFPRKLFYFRHLVSRGARDFLLPFATIQEGSPGLLDALILARDFECIDPRDKIASIWNIAQDKTGLAFTPDYTRTMRDTYMDFTKAWAVQHSSLDILGAVEPCGNQSFYRDTPSWCPDWSRPSMASCFVRRERIPNTLMMAINSLDGALYSADGDLKQYAFDEPLFHFEEYALCCTVILLDQVHFILKEPPEMPDGFLIPFGADPVSYHKFQTWTKELVNHFSANGITTYDDNLQAATALMHGDCVAAWPTRDQNPENCSESHPDETYVCDPQHSRHITRYGGDYDRNTAWTTVKTVLRGRRPFVSESGYMGLLPSYIEDASNTPDKPLHLAILAGCSVPLLLREQDDESYKILGTCFVQGWMEGEALSTMMGADSAQEFWTALQDLPKLRIT